MAKFDMVAFDCDGVLVDSELITCGVLADMLNELRALTPANLWFDGLTTDAGKGTMQLTGAALDYSSVAFFQRNLQHSDFFEEPKLGQTQMSAGTNGVSVVKFTIDVSLKKGKKG